MGAYPARSTAGGQPGALVETSADPSFTGLPQSSRVERDFSTGVLGFGGDPEFLVGSQYLTDVSIDEEFKGPGNIHLYAVISNLFNANPPLDPSNFIIAAATNVALYDVVGRTFTAGVRIEF
jgi:outer membrane receptor protein involved in Fe transport